MLEKLRILNKKVLGFLGGAIYGQLGSHLKGWTLRAIYSLIQIDQDLDLFNI
jgi:hypothetical protein